MPVRMHLSQHARAPLAGQASMEEEKTWRSNLLATWREQTRAREAMAIRLSLEKEVPWAILSVPADERSIDLLALRDQCGEAELMRGARAFAACDLDRDGLLCADEIFRVVAKLQELWSSETSLPDDVSLDDANVAAAWQHFEAACENQLDAISLLRLLVPPPVLRAGVRRSKPTAQRQLGADSVRKGAEGATDDEALVEERLRVMRDLPCIDERDSSGLPIVPFLATFLQATSKFRSGVSAVRTLAQEQKRAASAAQAAAEGMARRARAAAAAEADRRRRQELEAVGVHAGADELESLLARVAPDALMPEGVAAVGDSDAAAEETNTDSGEGDGNSPAIGGASDAQSPSHSVSFCSQWRPSVELHYVEKQRKSKQRGLYAMLDRLD